ncbi:MAG: protein kinase [Lachnospiraceae bacterium]|nr:protein kinase [Lachnospiraceae bacterium]
MNLLDKIFKNNSQNVEPEDEQYEYCPNCDANLTLQKGYSNDLPFWTCKGCGKLLINPELDTDNIAWVCDKCGAMLNIQEGFADNDGEWTCRECGFVNRIDLRELYMSEDEYQAEKNNPYRGLSDEAVLALSAYEELEHIDGHMDVIKVRHRESGHIYVKKLLTTYNRSVFDYILEHPIEHMPRVLELYESDNCLIVIEDFIEGKTVEEMLEGGAICEKLALSIVIDVCKILEVMHGLKTPIIHRDIKPSNIIITPEGDVYLLDMNVAKWFDPDKNDDTRYLGTRVYAAPEQVGYGMTASSAKSDVYALGVLLNVMTTGRFPKELRATGKLWNIIERCICLDAQERISVTDLIEALQGLEENDAE